VNVLFEQIFCPLQQFSADDHGRGGAVPDFIVLGLCYLHHHLCCRVLNVHLFQDGDPVIGNHDIADRVDKHLVHALGAERSPYCACNGLCGGNIHTLCIASTGT